jgi:hypothetical protein
MLSSVMKQSIAYADERAVSDDLDFGKPMAAPVRFPIKFDASYALLSRALLLPPSDAYVEIDGTTVSVRMGWGFRARFDRARVRATSVVGKRVPFTRGAHGWAGRWLVNGAGDGILTIDLDPQQRAYVLGFPVGLRQLQVSVDDPRALAAALGS